MVEIAMRMMRVKIDMKMICIYANKKEKIWLAEERKAALADEMKWKLMVSILNS